MNKQYSLGQFKTVLRGVMQSGIAVGGGVSYDMDRGTAYLFL